MRNFRKIALLSVLAILSMVALHAQAVEIQVIQHDINLDDVRKPSEILESRLMDNFFDNGSIVTNAPIVPQKDSKRDASLVKSALKEANEGGCNYVIVVTVDYSSSASLNPLTENLQIIEKISWKLIESGNSSEIASKAYKINKVSKANNSAQGVKLLADEIFGDILDAMKK